MIFTNSLLDYSPYALFSDPFRQILTNIDTLCINQLNKLILSSIMFNFVNNCKSLTKELLPISSMSKPRYEVSLASKTDCSKGLSVNSPLSLRNKINHCKYTLVLDLDETLVHYFLVSK